MTGSGIFNILVSPTRSRFLFYSSIHCFLLAYTQGFLCHTPSLGCFLNHGGSFYNPFTPEIAFMTLELETEAWSCPVLFTWTGIWQLPRITFEFYSKFSLLMFFGNRLFLSPILFTNHRMNWKGSSPEGTTSFISGLFFKPLISLSTRLSPNIIFPGAMFPPQIVHFAFVFLQSPLLHCGSA